MKVIRRSLIVIHFVLITITIFHMQVFIRNSIALGIMDYYCAFTYTNRCFGFFAPDVGNDLKLRMIMSNKKEVQEYHIKNRNFEMRTRLYSLTGHFAEDNQQSTMDLFARSWGVKCLNDYPTMNKVNITVYQNNIPTMIQYQHGKRISQEVFYSTDVEKQ